MKIEFSFSALCFTFLLSTFFFYFCNLFDDRLRAQFCKENIL